MLKRLQTNFDDPTLNRVISQIQDSVGTEFVGVNNSPFVGGKLISSVSLVTGQDNFVQHLLGYVPNVVLTLAPNVDVRVWNPTSTSLGGASANREVLNLRSSANCVVSVWVK